ncbi:hypothetical protein [Streptomyces lavendofoliae]|uniref:Uncharacterized protein n=1 Tax=Streptomyces lavendofoliae TaxID=67314 RepID=A0A918I316_9ACTN|nr:hypothetical protein [Streptomyces lavendofoliae]GGU61242.1 hypothetical protein GCM10010274_57620 [Streptomyces lavendofoliae]
MSEASQEPAPSRLVKAGVIVTLLASAAGLITTAVATLYDAKVARSQLAQSRQVADEKTRVQAARVSYWVDRPPDGTSRVHLMNRSLDPISNIHMTFRAEWDDHDVPSGLHKTAWVSFAVVVPSVPPCSDMVFSEDSLRFKERKKGDRPSYRAPYEKAPPPDEGWRDFGDTRPWLNAWAAKFADRNGVSWVRERNGLLTRGDRTPAPGWGLQGAVIAVAESPQTLKSCGE